MVLLSFLFEIFLRNFEKKWLNMIWKKKISQIPYVYVFLHRWRTRCPRSPLRCHASIVWLVTHPRPTYWVQRSGFTELCQINTAIKKFHDVRIWKTEKLSFILVSRLPSLHIVLIIISFVHDFVVDENQLNTYDDIDPFRLKPHPLLFSFSWIFYYVDTTSLLALLLSHCQWKIFGVRKAHT